MPNKKQKILLSWQSGGEKKEPDAIKIIVAFVAIVITAAYAFFTGEWLMGVTFIVLIIVFAWYLVASKKHLEILITEGGIEIQGQFYSFEKIKEYWVSSANNTLYLVPVSRLNPPIAVPLGSQSKSSIVRLLPKAIVERDSDDKDTLDKISGFLDKK